MTEDNKTNVDTTKFYYEYQILLQYFRKEWLEVKLLRKFK